MRMPPAAVVEAQVLALPSVVDAVDEIAHDVRAEAQYLAYHRAYDKGTYTSLIQLLPRGGVLERRRVVATDRKSKWLEEGTGIYGPERKPIKPKRGKYLVFTVPTGRTASGRRGEATVFARSVRGRPASWVMRDAAMHVAEARGARFTNHRSFRGGLAGV